MKPRTKIEQKFATLPADVQASIRCEDPAQFTERTEREINFNEWKCYVYYPIENRRPEKESKL